MWPGNTSNRYMQNFIQEDDGKLGIEKLNVEVFWFFPVYAIII